MPRVSAVIGANYGDEGKGLVTDFLAQPESLVVRFNGGAQAGHTVVTPDGRRHVFHHFGSGTLRGAATYLSHFFLINPLVFREELLQLTELGVKPVVAADPMCWVTTPFDMIINRIVEDARSGKRHGSCGMGINETVHRSSTTDRYTIYLKDIAEDQAGTWRKLRDIRDYYLPKRLAEFNIREHTYDIGDNVMMRWFGDALFMLDHMHISMWAPSMTRDRDVIFEGAQGLRLDEYAPGFPHVTRSRTGLTNVAELMSYASMPSTLDVYYATRAYITRHGAGPLSHEGPAPAKFEDKTNVPNPYQGSFRFAPFVLPEFIEPVLQDYRAFPPGLATLKPRVVVTCVDHVPQGEEFAKKLTQEMCEYLPFYAAFCSDGPSRTNVKELWRK